MLDKRRIDIYGGGVLRVTFSKLRQLQNLMTALKGPFSSPYD